MKESTIFPPLKNTVRVVELIKVVILTPTTAVRSTSAGTKNTESWGKYSGRVLRREQACPVGRGYVLEQGQRNEATATPAVATGVGIIYDMICCVMRGIAQMKPSNKTAREAAREKLTSVSSWCLLTSNIPGTKIRIVANRS